MDEEMVLCAASSYEQKYYLNPEFESLPEAVKQELQIMCVLYTADVGGVLLLVFDENGKAVYSSVDKKQEEVFRPYLVRVEISDLNIRQAPQSDSVSNVYLKAAPLPSLSCICGLSR